MLRLVAPDLGRPLRVLCVGAHSDDMEIGCGGTLLDWVAERPVDVTWVVLSAVGARATEARRSARALLKGAARLDIVLGSFADGQFPALFADVKAMCTEIRRTATPPDIVFAHRLEDRHQDHRLAAELVWQIWRDQLVLEVEIPKWEGDLLAPNLYVPLSRRAAQRKVRHLMTHFATQRTKGWFSEPTFNGLMQLRAIETRAESGYAEAFHARKIRL